MDERAQMAITVKQLLFRRGILVALATTLVVAALLAVRDAALTGTTLMQLEGGEPQIAAGAFSLFPNFLLLELLPFCIGVFLSLWILAPIAAELTLGFVV